MTAARSHVCSSAVSVLCATAADPSGTKCPPAEGRPETCVCQPTNQDLVDLTPLSNTNGTAKCSIEIIELPDHWMIIIIIIRFTKVKDRNNYIHIPITPVNHTMMETAKIFT